MSYVPSTPQQRQAMLAAVGVKTYRDLYRDVPEGMLLDRGLDLPEGMSELDTARRISDMAEHNTKYRIILRGAGAYDHYIPSIRYMAIREGVTDLKYISLVKDPAKAREYLKRIYVTNSHDPKEPERVREEILKDLSR